MRAWRTNPPPATKFKLHIFNTFQFGDKKLNERLAVEAPRTASYSSGRARFWREFQRGVSLPPRMGRVEMLELQVPPARAVCSWHSSR
jgi:hypothetical protein